MVAWLAKSRSDFHAACVGVDGPITISPGKIKQTVANSVVKLRGNGIPNTTLDLVSVADNSSAPSIVVAEEIGRLIAVNSGSIRRTPKKPSGQGAGAAFEAVLTKFVSDSLPRLAHLRPGNFECQQGGVITDYDQYAHLAVLSNLAKQNDELSTVLGADYLIKPDVLVFREREPDHIINSPTIIVDQHVANLTPLREVNGNDPLLHASISCKLTMRSDRAQNSRSEALNLIRNRKGRLPNVVAVTAEPLPSRIASLALGTGDLDCVYHFALPELRAALNTLNMIEAAELVETMIEGQRLRDIADLPLDLAI